MVATQMSQQGGPHVGKDKRTSEGQKRTKIFISMSNEE